MPIKEDREYRSMELKATAPVDDVASKSYLVDGYATTFDSPYELYRDGKYIVMEQVDRHAFDDTYMGDTIFQYDHSGMVYARTRNDTLKLELNDHGLKVTADLSSTEASRGVWDAIDKGLIDRMSFAFTVTGDSYEEEEQENGDVIVTRTIKKIGRLYDVSAVSFPANEQTSISARSHLDGEIKRLEAERLHVREINEKRKALRDQISRIMEEKSHD